MMGKKSVKALALSGACAIALVGLASLAHAAGPEQRNLTLEKVFSSRDEAVKASGLDLDGVILMTPAEYKDGIALYQLQDVSDHRPIYVFVRADSPTEVASFVFVRGREVAVPGETLTGPAPRAASSSDLRALAAFCVSDGGWDDTLYQTSCCSGVAVSGTTSCFNAADYGSSWASCIHICGTQLVPDPYGGYCVPSGGIDDTLSNTSCCSGAAVSGSTHCLDPRDYGTSWRTYIQTYQ